MFNHRIYLDYASITPIDPRVIREVKKYSARKYSNPSSWYKEGVAAKKALDSSRKTVADFLHAHPDEIVFTSGGTEANGLALEGVARAARNAGIKTPHIIISCIEHSSIMETAKMLEKYGCEVTRLGVDQYGFVNLNELKNAIKSNTILISIMTVNNEIGTIQPIREITKVIRHAKKNEIIRPFWESRFSPGKPREGNRERPLSQAGVINNPFFIQYPLFHTDAAQAALYNELHVEKLGVDLMTLDSSKIYGPRGVGALYIKRGSPIEPIMIGGGQESGMRSGTENLPGVAGFAMALQIEQLNNSTIKNSKFNDSKFLALRSQMIEGLKEIRPDIKVNGPQDTSKVSPHILNVSIPGIDNEYFVMQLDANGIACSTKSSCLRDEKESYILRSIGAESNTSVRFSFGRWTTKRDIQQALKIVTKVLQSV